MISGGMVLLSMASPGTTTPDRRTLRVHRLARSRGWSPAGERSGSAAHPHGRGVSGVPAGQGRRHLGEQLLGARPGGPHPSRQRLAPTAAAIIGCTHLGSPSVGLSKSVTLDFLHPVPAVKYALRRDLEVVSMPVPGEFCDAR